MENLEHTDSGTRRTRTWPRELCFAVRRRPLFMAGMAIIVILVLVSVFAPLLASHNPRETDLTRQFRAPDRDHLFGTDRAGRDIYSRVLYGGRLALMSGLMILGICMTLGSLLGLIAGYLQKRVDTVIMRITDVFLAFPGLVLAMAVVAGIRSRSLFVLVLSIAIRWWAPYTRIMRAQAMAVREMEFVDAARAVGASDERIMLRHILPNTLSPIIVQGTLDLGYIILTAASLSFLGFGAPPETPEWGRMVADGREFIRSAWWITTFPGIAIFVSVLGFNLMGDGVREILDPRRRRGF